MQKDNLSDLKHFKNFTIPITNYCQSVLDMLLCLMNKIHFESQLFHKKNSNYFQRQISVGFFKKPLHAGMHNKQRKQENCLAEM